MKSYCERARDEGIIGIVGKGGASRGQRVGWGQERITQNLPARQMAGEPARMKADKLCAKMGKNHLVAHWMQALPCALCHG